MSWEWENVSEYVCSIFIFISETSANIYLLLVHSLAGELGLDIYVISLSKRGLDDSTLNTLISRLPSKAMALIEDIDAAFYHGLTRETAGSAPVDPSAPHSDGNQAPYPNPSVPSFPGAQPPPSTSKRVVTDFTFISNS